MPDFDAQNETGQQEYLYLLCYIPGSESSQTTTAELNLLDLSKLDNVRFLWSITVLINTSNTFPNMQIRSRTCSPSNRSAPARRASSDWADPELVKFFKLHVIPYVETVYSI